ncbi:CHAD domain-containing protein [Sneathiella sp. CAU 1612]|uniref:CHAD domain-containing protein n=1 Tax=Sneathiella sedimenti TaxID=2816034 RepID=A0ABS3F0M8_9PROT|nr:CHAD domain-containing protein [Sneathiella sedimenti]MBO0332056.1 CHAD domain-containing protein [Sneathiella sedimenti]
MSAKSKVLKLSHIDLVGSMDVETAAKVIFRGCALHLRENFRQFKEEGDSMALMQIRIGVRRMRVALYIFRSIIPKEVRSNFNREFRYFGNLLGDARNMDVFLNSTLMPEIKTKDFKKVSKELLRLGEIFRAEEYDIIIHEISGGHFERLSKSFDKWLQGNWSTKLGRSARKIMSSPIAPFALNAIEEGGIELLNRGADVENLSADELHDLRKYIKRTRYHLRFFSSLFRQEKIDEGYDLLVRMQDYLGHINDVKEGMIILSQLSAAIRADYFAETLRFNARVYGDASKEVEHNLAEFRALWRKFEDFTIDKKDLRKAV